MASFWSYFFSALTAAIIGGGGVITGAVINSQGPIEISQTTVMLSIVVALVSAAQDLRSQMKLPPATEKVRE